MPNKRPLQVDTHRIWIGEFASRVAVWFVDMHSENEARLLTTLAVLATPRSGLVLVEKSRLAWILATKPEVIDQGLASLAEQRLIRLMESGPYLVISLKSWSARGERAEREIPLKSGANGAQKPPSIPPPVANASPFEKNSSNVSRATATAERHSAGRVRGDGVKGAGSGEEGWLEGFIHELAVLIDDPAELASLKTFCERYDHSVLTQALERLKRTPKDHIRKSPAALFTYLVKTIYHQRQP